MGIEPPPAKFPRSTQLWTLEAGIHVARVAKVAEPAEPIHVFGGSDDAWRRNG